MDKDRSAYLIPLSVFLIIIGIFFFWDGYMNLDIGFYNGPFNPIYVTVMIFGLIFVIIGLPILAIFKKNTEEFKIKIILIIIIIVVLFLLLLPIIYETFFVNTTIM